MNPCTTERDFSISELLVPRPYRVVGRTEEGPEVWSLRVQPVEGDLPCFAPAQVSMVGAFGVGEAALSISSATTDHESHTYTIRRAGAITSALINTEVGGIVTVRGPFGSPWPLETIETSSLAIIAGGLGIVPLKSALHAVMNDPDRFSERALIYGARSAEDLLFSRLLRQWGADGLEVSLTVDRAESGWSGRVGLVPDRLGGDGVGLDWPNTTCLVCGPDVMMHFTARRLLELGVQAEHIWMTLERNMQCGNALCGHCQLGPIIVCRDGPVVNYTQIEAFQRVPEL